MNGQKYILEKQLDWARRKGISLKTRDSKSEKKAYVKDLAENLFEKLSSDSIEEFQSADGGELISTELKSAKMCALHSSSAIGINFLQYWREKNVSQLAYLLGLCRKTNDSAKQLRFEQKFVIDKSFSKAPNLDAVIFNEGNQIKAFGIECKFSEPYSKNHDGLKEKYLNLTYQWKDIPNLFEFAKKISPEDNEFTYLHSAQLIKHIILPEICTTS